MLGLARPTKLSRVAKLPAPVSRAMLFFHLPDGFQAVAQVFAALEADEGAVGVDTGGLADVLCAVGRAPGRDAFQGFVNRAVQGDVGQGGAAQAGDGDGQQGALGCHAVFLSL